MKKLSKVKKSGIYKIVNIINGKCYIGSTLDLNSRKNGHFGKLRINKHYNKHLQSAWNKYGAENFIFIVIREVKNIDLLIRFEQCYINVYKSYEIGYNKRKIADSNKGNKWSLEARKRLSDKKRGGKGNINQINSVKGNKFNKGGYKLSKEFRDKRSKHSKNFWKNIDKDAKEAMCNKISAKMKGRKNPKAVISEKCKQASIKKLKKPVVQFDRDWNFIKIWESGSEVCKNLNINSSALSAVLRGRQKSVKNFKFKYYKDFLQENNNRND